MLDLFILSTKRKWQKYVYASYNYFYIIMEQRMWSVMIRHCFPWHWSWRIFPTDRERVNNHFITWLFPFRCILSNDNKLIASTERLLLKMCFFPPLVEFYHRAWFFSNIITCTFYTMEINNKRIFHWTIVHFPIRLPTSLSETNRERAIGNYQRKRSNGIKRWHCGF